MNLDLFNLDGGGEEKGKICAFPVFRIINTDMSLCTFYPFSCVLMYTG